MQNGPVGGMDFRDRYLVEKVLTHIKPKLCAQTQRFDINPFVVAVEAGHEITRF